MTSRVIYWLLQHRILVAVAIAIWGLVGMMVVWQTPMDALPDLSDNQVLVYAFGMAITLRKSNVK